MNINFVHGDIKQKLINDLLFDADVVHHLAGITNVPRTKVVNGPMMKKLN